MYYHNSLKLKLTCTTVISLLLGVMQGTGYRTMEEKVGTNIIIGPCKNDKEILHSIVIWEVHQNGKKTHTITEKRPGKGDHIRLIKNQYGESNLEIQNIKEDDAGLYICKTGATANLNINAEIELIVKFAPKLQCPSCNQTANEGETPEMWCNATGIPKPTIAWSRKSQVNDGIGISGNLLRIQNVTRYAKDIYMCNASNGEGHVVGRINLDVFFPAQLEVLEKELQRLNTDMGVEMVCAVTANPMVNIVWYKGDKEIPVKEQPFKYNVDTQDDMREEYYTRFSILKIISALDQSDFDTYYCKAQNGSGHVVATETITLVRHLGN